MAEIINYESLGINKWLEQETSLLANFEDIQFYSTLNVDPDTGEPITNQVSAGLTTINTENMSQVEVNALLGNISATQLTSGDISQPINLISGHIQSANFITGSTGWRINADGDAEFSDITLTGGTLKYGKTSFTDSTNAGYHISSSGFYFGSASDAKYLKYNISSGALTLHGTAITSPTLTAIQSGSEIAIQGWQQDMTFSASDYRTVAWGSGTITLLDGITYSITGANTGNMSALTYIYLDIGISTTLLQVSTTASDAVGTGKILIAVAEDNSDTSSKASYQVFGGKGGNNIFVDNIAANSASTNEFISNTAQIKDAIITNAKIDSLAVSKLTAGTITSKTISLAVAAGTGDSYIAAGKTDFTNTDAGFILGLDDSDSDLAKFYIGNNSIYMNWDGSSLTLNSAGINVLNEGLKFYDSTTLRGEVSTAATNIAFQLYNDAAAVINSLFIGSTAIYSTQASDLGNSGSPFIHGYLRQVTITQSASQNTGNALLVQRNVVPASTDDPVLKVIQDHVDDTENAALILQDGLATALQVQSANNNNTADSVYILASGNQAGLSVNLDYASCVKSVLKLNHDGNGPHINFSGDPANNDSPADGDMWFDGTNLKFRIGSTNYNIDMT